MADDKTLDILAHVLGILVGFIGPLIILLVAEKEQSKKHARRALNWQISFMIYVIVSIVLMIVLIGFLTLAVASILNLIFCIVGAIRASEGKLYDYPMAIPFLRDE